MEQLRVLINGITGKMGQAAKHAISSESDLTLVGGLRNGDDLDATIISQQPDVVVDLTHPSVGYTNTLTILKQGCHAVVGTTGFTSDQLSEIDAVAQSQKRVAMIIPNFAIGAVMMMKMARELVSFMPSVEIIEYHHPLKADSPSGTAIQTAQELHQGNPTLNAHRIDGPGRGDCHYGVPIHSVRLDGFVASQSVIFGELGQTLTIRHDTISREAFMPGLLLCIRQAPSMIGLVSRLDDVLAHVANTPSKPTPINRRSS